MNATRNHTIQNLQSISRDGDRFFALYAWDENEKFAFAMPVYTGGMNANGTVTKSRALRKIARVVDVERKTEKVAISRDEAEAHADAAKMTNMIDHVERVSRTHNVWVLYIKDNACSQHN